MQFWAIIADSFRESRDRKIFWVMIGLSCLVAAAMACVAFRPGEIELFFGVWTFETQHFTSGTGLRNDMIATLIVDGVMDTTLGWIGMVFAIIATAGFIPSLLERGVIDVVLAKPISRWNLFLTKYLGTMVFVFIQASVFVGLTLLVAGVRWGVWLPTYLWTIPLVVVLFSYFYCISALVAVYYRSPLVAVLISLGAWVVFAGIQSADDFYEMGGLAAFDPTYQHKSASAGDEQQNVNKSNSLRQVFRVARWVVPKTQDITYLARKMARGAQATDLMPSSDPSGQEMMDRGKRIEAQRMSLPAWQTMGSSLLFEAVIVAVAMWKFSRTDY